MQCLVLFYSSDKFSGIMIHMLTLAWLCHWHWSNCKIAPVPVRKYWRVLVKSMVPYHNKTQQFANLVKVFWMHRITIYSGITISAGLRGCASCQKPSYIKMFSMHVIFFIENFSHTQCPCCVFCWLHQVGTNPAVLSIAALGNQENKQGSPDIKW